MSEEVESFASDKPTSLAAWKKSAVHNLVLPSGTVIGMKIPDVPTLIEAGTIPNHLLEAALGAAKNPEDQAPTRDMISQEREFTDLLVHLSVVDPKVSVEDAADIPMEDKAMIVAVATRQRDIDAEGNHIAGLDKSEKFRRFRRVGEFDPLLESL